MLRYHFKLIVRSLLRRKIYALVILLSLTVAFVCSNLLISFLVYENNTDRFHLKGERIFQAFTDDPFGGNGRIAYIPSYFSDYLLSNYAEAEAVCQIGSIDGARVTANGNTADNLIILSVDSSFFQMFDFPLNGDRRHDLESGQLVLSREKAISLFGTGDVIGKDVTLQVSDTTLHLVISGVTDQPSDNSHLNFDALIHHSVLPKFWTGGASYVMMGSAASADGLREKINKDPQRPGLLGAGTMTYTLSPLSESYFNTDNRMSYMKTRSPMFMKVGYVVCALILLIAGFNSFNLFTLFWQDRKKEVGIKKTLGVSPTSLLSFAAMETGFYILISYLLSLLLTYLLTPLFSMVFETKLTMEYLMNFRVSLLVGAVLILTAILLILLSLISQWRMKPVSLMSRESERMSFSRGLFTIQFVISITLVICSITVIRQMQYLESAPLGFNRNIIQLNSPDQKEKEKLLVLKQRVVQLPEIAHVAVGSGNPIAGNLIVRYELENKQFYTPYLFEGDADYLSTLDLKLVAGVMPSAGNQGKLVNQALVRQFHLTDPVGEKIPGTRDIIAGVVEDFTCSSFKMAVPPVIISYNPTGRSLLIDYSDSDMASLLPRLQSAWKEVFPDYAFSYQIIQEVLMNKYKEDTFFFRIVIAFAVVTMILSCFGLFALSWAVVQRRTREMGIRKVLGATSIDILNLLTLTFTRRIAIAFLIAAPIGYYAMNQWLVQFANRVELNLWSFVLAAMLMTAVALLTLGFQTLKAAMTNPAEEIREE